MEQLIKGDYLYFTIGNLISDAAIASFAYLIFRIGDLDSRINNYIVILESAGLDRIDLLKIKSAFLLLEFDLLEESNLLDENRRILTNFYKKKDKLNTYIEFLFLIFILGLIIEAISILSTRV